MSFYSKRFVFHCQLSDTIRDLGLKTPESIERFDNIRYGENKKWQVLDVYRPKKAEGKLPVIISNHGGGWVYGSKKTYQYYCMNLAERGFVVINFSYRLAPKFKFPAALEDTNLVFDWLMKNADKYNIDINNIFAVGDSAGATNMGLYAAMLVNEEYAGKFKFKLTDNVKIKAIGLNFGIYDMFVGSEHCFVKDIFEYGGNIPELDQMSLVFNLNDKFPPTFIMTANEDFLNKQVPYLTKVFDEKKIQYVSRQYGSDEMPLYHVFHCNIRTEEAKVANDDEIAFFNKFIVS